MVLSQREWEMICDWYAREVPLELVREALEAASAVSAPGRRSGRPRSLAYVAPAVEEAWSVVRDGKLVEHLPSVAEEDRSASACRSRRCAEPENSRVAELLDDLLGRLGQGEPGAELDLELDDRLAAAVPADLLLEVEVRLSIELGAFRDRMTGEVYRTTYARAVADRLRGRLGLPRLAGRRRTS